MGPQKRVGGSERAYVEDYPDRKRFQEHAQGRSESGYARFHASRLVNDKDDLGLSGLRGQVELRDKGDHEGGGVGDGGVGFEDGGGGGERGTFYEEDEVVGEGGGCLAELGEGVFWVEGVAGAGVGGVVAQGHGDWV